MLSTYDWYLIPFLNAEAISADVRNHLQKLVKTQTFYVATTYIYGSYYKERTV
jgi:hypothetical protein